MLQINDMQELFRRKFSDFNMIQDGMKKIKEFEKTKAQMEQELSDVRVVVLFVRVLMRPITMTFLFCRLEKPWRSLRRSTGKT